MVEFTPVDVEAWLKDIHEFAAKMAHEESRMRVGLDALFKAGTAALALEAWVQAEPDQREALIVKVRAGIDAEPHWLATLTRTTQHGSVHGTHKDSMAGAVGEALQNWERMYGRDS